MSLWLVLFSICRSYWLCIGGGIMGVWPFVCVGFHGTTSDTYALERQRMDLFLLFAFLGPSSVHVLRAQSGNKVSAISLWAYTKMVRFNSELLAKTNGGGGALFNWPYWRFSDNRKWSISIPSSITLKVMLVLTVSLAPPSSLGGSKAPVLSPSLLETLLVANGLILFLLNAGRSSEPGRTLPREPQCNSFSTCLHGLTLQREKWAHFAPFQVSTFTYAIRWSAVSELCHVCL